MRFPLSLLAAALFATLPLGAKPIGNYLDADGRPILTPPVQKFTPTEAKFALPERLAVTVPQGSEHLVALLDRAVKTRWPKRGAVAAAPGETAQCRFLLSPSAAKDPEGYTLAIGESEIVAAASTPRGLYYAAQTLCNMISNVPGPELPGAQIADRPDLALRGVYLRLRDLRPDEVDRFCRVIDAFGSLKYNTLVLEFADNFPYRKNPFSLRKFTLSKAEVGRIVAAAKRNHMEIVPMLQVLSHDEWLQTHPKYWSEISEGKPAFAWGCSSCPTKPLPRELNTMAIREQCEFLRPRRFMICLDEISQCPWRVCPECRKRDSAELWREQTVFYTDFTLKHGAAPIIFHDCYYPGNGTFVKGWEALEKTDRRTLICNWDYAKTIKGSRFDFFKERGFTVIGMSYCNTIDNVMSLPRAVKERSLPGVVLSYWHNLWRFTVPHLASPEGFAGTTLAGVYQWKCAGPEPARQPYDPAFETMRRFVPEQCSEIRPGVRAAAIPLDAVFNRRLGGDPNFPRFGAETAAELRREAASLPEKFAFPAARGGYAALVLSGGKDNYPAGEAAIPIGVKAAKFSLLMTGGMAGDPPRHELQQPPVGRLTLRWADGKTMEMPLAYRRHLAEWNAPVSGGGCRFALRGNEKGGANYAFFAVDIVNPRPETEVTEIRLATLKQCGFPFALLALSAIDPDRAPAAPEAAAVAAALQTLPASAPMSGEAAAVPTIVCGFEKGLGPARILPMGSKFAGKVTYRIIDDPTSPGKGKVLEITVPPTAELHARNRVCVDLLLPGFDPEKMRSITFDYRFDVPEFIEVPAFYLFDAKIHHGVILYSFAGKRDSRVWQRIVYPIAKMRKEVGGFAPGEKPGAIRVSFFIRYHTNPCRIYLARIGFLDREVPETPVLRYDRVE